MDNFILGIVMIINFVIGCHVCEDFKDLSLINKIYSVCGCVYYNLDSMFKRLKN